MHISNSRRWQIVGLVALLSVICVGEALAQDWKGRGRISGKVTDQEGNPIKDAKVTILYRGQEENGPDPVATNKKGRWAVMGLSSAPYTVRVEAEGFYGTEGEVRVNEYAQAPPPPVDMELRKFDAEAIRDEASDRLMGVLNEGNALLQSGDNAGARAKFEEVLAEVDDDAQARQLNFAIANTYLGEGNNSVARTKYEELLASAAEESTGEKMGLLQQIARSYYQEDNIDQSVATLEKALAIDPTSVVALRRIVDTLISVGRVEDAEPYMARLPEGEKVDPNALLNLGISAYNNGEMDTAFEKFTTVVEEYPDNATAYYYLGLVYLGKGKSPEAKANLEKMLELDPENKFAKEAKEFLTYLE